MGSEQRSLQNKRHFLKLHGHTHSMRMVKGYIIYKCKIRVFRDRWCFALTSWGWEALAEWTPLTSVGTSLWVGKLKVFGGFLLRVVWEGWLAWADIGVPCFPYICDKCSFDVILGYTEGQGFLPISVVKNQLKPKGLDIVEPKISCLIPCDVLSFSLWSMWEMSNMSMNFKQLF